MPFSCANTLHQKIGLYLILAFKKGLKIVKDPCMKHKVKTKQHKAFPVSLLSNNLPMPSAAAKHSSSYLSKHKAAQ